MEWVYLLGSVFANVELVDHGAQNLENMHLQCLCSSTCIMFQADYVDAPEHPSLEKYAI